MAVQYLNIYARLKAQSHNRISSTADLSYLVFKLILNKVYHIDDVKPKIWVKAWNVIK